MREASTSGTKVTVAAQNSVIKINTILRQHLKKSKSMPKKICDEENILEGERFVFDIGEVSSHYYNQKIDEMRHHFAVRASH